MNQPAMPPCDTAPVLAAVTAIIERVTMRPQPGLRLATPLDVVDGLDSLRLLEIVAQLAP